MKIRIQFTLYRVQYKITKLGVEILEKLYAEQNQSEMMASGSPNTTP